MNVAQAKDWVLAISASISMLSVAIGILITIKQYRLKLREEERLATSSRAEVDIRLIKAFTEVMDLAMGRRQHVLSEKAVEELFRIGVFSKDDLESSNYEKVESKLTHYSVVIVPTGGAGQTAAIAAAAEMARKYQILANAAAEGLKIISSRGKHKHVAEWYLKKIFSSSPVDIAPDVQEKGSEGQGLALT